MAIMNEELIDQLKSIKTSEGQDLYNMTFESPVLLVFLRQFGCVFCQQALKDLVDIREIIQSKGVRLCFVHMASTEEGDEYFKKFGFGGVPHISDPQCEYYALFGLIKAKFSQLFGLQVWLKTFEAAIKEKNNLFAKQIGDGFQMPGVFFLRNGIIEDRYLHERASDRPDYSNLIDCCLT